MGDDDPIAKAKAIAARLANITSTTSDLLGKRKFDGIADMGRKKKKVYIPVDKFPNVNFIGLLIGPRGSNQKRMEELSGAKILVRGKGSSREGDPDELEDLHVMITGDTDAQVDAAYKEIEEILFNPDKAQSIKREQLRKVAEINGADGSHYGPDGTNSASVQVPRELVGYVIGRGGETIRDLQLKSGAHIQVAREFDESEASAMRIVSIDGTEEAVKQAKILVENLISDRASASGGHYGPGKGDSIIMVVPNDKVGLIIGRGGTTIKGIQQRTGANIQVPNVPDAGNPQQRTLELSGSPDVITAAQNEINMVISNDPRSIGFEHGLPIVVPNDRVGIIIGRKGETVKGIQDRTGARVQIPNEADPGTNPPVRTITLTGSQDAMQTAKYEIECVIAEQPKSSSYGGGYAANQYGGTTGASGHGYADPYGQQYYGAREQQSSYGAESTGAYEQQAADPNSYWNGYYEYAAYYGTEAANAAWGVTAEATANTATEGYPQPSESAYEPPATDNAAPGTEQP